jgi:hypothetical protein
MNQNNSLFVAPFAALFSLLLLFSTIAGVYAQTSSNTTNGQTSHNPIGMPMNDDMSMGSYEAKQQDNNLTSSISIFQPIINAFKSMIKVDINDAITTARGAVGDNATTIAAFLHPEKHYIVYTVIVLDSSGTPHKVLVDPGNGNLLKDEKTSFMKLMMLVHGGKGGMMGQGNMMGPEMGMMGQGNMMGPEMGMMGQGNMMGPEMGMMGPDIGMMCQGHMMGHGDAENSWD